MSGKGNGQDDPNQGRQPTRQEQQEQADRNAQEANKPDRSGNGK